MIADWLHSNKMLDLNQLEQTWTLACASLALLTSGLLNLSVWTLNAFHFKVHRWTSALKEHTEGYQPNKANKTQLSRAEQTKYHL